MEPDEFSLQVEQLRQRLTALEGGRPEDEPAADATGQDLDARVQFLSDSTRLLAELNTALEELSVAEDEMRAQNLELTAARDALEAERHRYRALFDFAPDAYLVTTLQGRILEANQAAADLLALPSETLVQKVLPVFVPYQDRAEFRQRLNQVPGVERVSGWEIRLQPRNTRPLVLVEATVGTVRDERGRPQGLRWLLRDISERKQMEAERDAAQRTLTQHLVQLEVLHGVDRAILAARSATEIAGPAAARLRALAQCSRVSVMVYRPEREEAEYLAADGAGPSKLAAGRRVPLADVRWHAHARLHDVFSVADMAEAAEVPAVCSALAQAGLRSFLSLPLRVDGRVIGSLNLSDHRAGEFAGETIALARQVADSLAVALQNARLVELLSANRTELQSLSRRLVTAQEAERSTIARELHDEVGQAIVSLMLGLRAVQNAGPEADTLNARIDALQRTADEVLGRLHRLAVNLRPASLDRLGLVPAVEQYVLDFKEDTSLDTQFATVELDGHVRLDPEVATALFRVVQEALTNVARHAQAQHVGVVLERRDDWLVVIVEDDGVGFDTPSALASDRLGLVGMRERVEALGGKLTIDSAPGRGTTVHTEVPYERADSDRR